MAKSHFRSEGCRPQINWYGDMGHGLDLKSKVYMPWEKRIEGIVLRRGHVPKLVDSPIQAFT